MHGVRFLRNALEDIKPRVEAEVRRAIEKTAGVRPPATPDVEVVKARDAAILERLRHSPASDAQLLTVLPEEAGRHKARVEALGNVLLRLRVKRRIRKVQDGWALA